MNTKVTVIGGAGFIGSHLVEELVSLGFEVTVIDNFSTGNVFNLEKVKVKIVSLDILDGPHSLVKHLAGSSWVFHLAALTSVQESIENPYFYTQVNVVGTANVLEACKTARVEKLIFSSTSAVYGNTTVFPTSEKVKPDPLSTYALTKLVGEQYCKYYSEVTPTLSTVCLRYFNVYGDRTNPKSSYRSVLPIFIDQAKAGKPLTYTNDGGQARDFIHVSDVVKANIAAMNIRSHHEVLNIGSGEMISINQIMDHIGGTRQYIGGRLEPRISHADTTRAQSILSWAPRVNLLNWIKDQIG